MPPFWDKPPMDLTIDPLVTGRIVSLSLIVAWTEALRFVQP